MSYEAALVGHYAAVRSRLGAAPSFVPRVEPPHVVKEPSPPAVIGNSDVEKIRLIIAAAGNKPTVGRVVVATAAQYELPVTALISPCRPPEVARPCMIGMAVSRAITRQSFRYISDHFGGRDPTMALAAIRKYHTLIEQAMTPNPPEEQREQNVRPSAVIAAYRKLGRMRAVATELDVPLEHVQQILHLYAPHLIHRVATTGAPKSGSEPTQCCQQA